MRGEEGDSDFDLKERKKERKKKKEIRNVPMDGCHGNWDYSQV